MLSLCRETERGPSVFAPPTMTEKRREGPEYRERAGTAQRAK
jgi:hypothetical protein